MFAPPASPHWLRLATPEGRPYFFSPALNQTSWFPPGEVGGPPAPHPPAQQSHTDHEVQQRQDDVVEKAVSMKRIVPGTEWRQVTTNLNSHFFYNPATKVATWTTPQDLAEYLAGERQREIQRAAEEARSTLVEREEALRHGRAEDEHGGDDAHRHKRPRGEEDTQVRDLPADGSEAEEAFLSLLREKKVSAFSTWEKELQKLADDPRFRAVASVKERKLLYEQYCRVRAQEEKAERMQQLENSRERFLQLIKEGLNANTISFKTTFDEFTRRFKGEPRMKLLDAKEREALFKEHVTGLRDKEVEKRKAELEKAKRDFVQLLRDTPEIGADSRYARIRRYIDRDKRYDAVKSSTLREELFETYVRGLSVAETEREREKREERSLKDRERHVHRDQERRLQESKAGRGQYQKEEGRRVFQTMLVDYAKTHEAVMDQVEQKMKNDSRWEQVSLSSAEQKELFDKHVDVLYDKTKKAFFAALENVVGDNLTMTWEVVMRDHPEIRDDPRYLRLSSHPPTRERQAPSLFAEFARFKLDKGKQDYRELLKENRFVAYQISAETRGQPVRIGEIEAALEKDKRFQVLGFMAEERRQMLQAHLDELQAKLKDELEKRAKIEQGELRDH